MIEEGHVIFPRRSATFDFALQRPAQDDLLWKKERGYQHDQPMVFHETCTSRDIMKHKKLPIMIFDVTLYPYWPIIGYWYIISMISQSFRKITHFWCSQWFFGIFRLASKIKNPDDGCEFCRENPASSKMLPTATPIQTAVKAPKRKFQGQSLGQQKWINYSHIYIYGL